MLHDAASLERPQDQSPPVSRYSATVQTNFLTVRVPYAGKALLRGEILVTYTDSRTAQSAICGLTYQQGQSDQQLTPTITPSTQGVRSPRGPAATRTISEAVAVWLAVLGNRDSRKEAPDGMQRL